MPNRNCCWLDCSTQPFERCGDVRPIFDDCVGPATNRLLLRVRIKVRRWKDRLEDSDRRLDVLISLERFALVGLRTCTGMAFA